MAQLTANKKRDYGVIGINEVGVKASTTIFEGSAVGVEAASGYARQLTAGDQFIGFALEKVINTGSNAALNVKVQSQGFVRALFTVAATDQGKAVYMSDGDVFTLTQSTNTHVGSVYRFISTSECIVAFDASNPNSLFGIAELTDNSGGTPSDTIADVPGSYTEATLANQIASLTAKINAILRVLRT